MANGKQTLAMGVAMAKADEIVGLLQGIMYDLHTLREFAVNKKHFSLLAGGQCPSGGLNEFLFSGGFEASVPQGYVFTGQRLIATAPAGAKLQIFRDRVTPDNLLEVAANVQEYADGILGPMVVEGPANLIVVLSGTTAAGNCSIALSGELVEKVKQSPKAVR